MLRQWIVVLAAAFAQAPGWTEAELPGCSGATLEAWPHWEACLEGDIGHGSAFPVDEIEGPHRAAGAVPDAAIYRDIPPCAAPQR